RGDGGPFASASENRGDSALAQFESEQLAQCLNDPFVTQMLLVFQKDHRRLQARPKIAIRFQPRRQSSPIEALPVWPEDYLLSRFNPHRVEFGSLGHLPADDLSRRDATKVEMALFALLDRDADRPIGIVDQFSNGSFVAEGRSMLLLGLIA